MSRFAVLLTGLLLAMGLPSLALATPGAEVQRADRIHVDQFGFVLRGEQRRTNLNLTKVRGILDLSVDARAMGLPFDGTLLLRGTRVGDRLTWALSHTLTAPQEVGPGYALTRLEATLVADAALIPDASDPRCGAERCPFNVHLEGRAGSQLHFFGTGPLGAPWEEMTTDVRLSAYAGVPRPPLTGFSLAPGEMVCQSVRRQNVIGRVSLAGPAPTGGARVTLTSTNPLVRTFASIIPEGLWGATVPVVVEAGFTGTVEVQASSGGVEQTQPLRVSTNEDCALYEMVMRAEQLAACWQCLIDDFGPRGTLAGTRVGWPVVVSAGKVISLPTLFGEGWPVIQRLNAWDYSVGTWLHASGETVAFLRNGLEGAQTFTFPDVTLSDLNDQGVAVGTRGKGDDIRAVVVHGQKLNELLVGGDWSTARALNEAGEVVGSYGSLASPGRTRGYIYLSGKAQDLGGLGGSSVVPVDLNESGDVVGTATDAKGAPHAFLWTRTSRALAALGTLPGLPSSRAVAINNAGWVAGVATDGKTQRGFLFHQDHGLVDLTQLVGSADVIVEEPLRLDDASRVLVRGFLKGQRADFLLVPELKQSF